VVVVDVRTEDATQCSPLPDPRLQMAPSGVGGGAGAYVAPSEHDRLLLHLNRGGEQRPGGVVVES